jgi:hypothetical protein
MDEPLPRSKSYEIFTGYMSDISDDEPMPEDDDSDGRETGNMAGGGNGSSFPI